MKRCNMHSIIENCINEQREVPKGLICTCNEDDKTDHKFMDTADLISYKSKDPNTKVGAVIVSKFGKILSTGYNCFPKGIDHSRLPWNREGLFEETKYAYVVHAEANAILSSYAIEVLEDVSMYTTMFPCNECAKLIVQKGIKEVIYKTDPYHEMPAWIASRRLLKLAHVKVRQYVDN